MFTIVLLSLNPFYNKICVKSVCSRKQYLHASEHISQEHPWMDKLYQHCCWWNRSEWVGLSYCTTRGKVLSDIVGVRWWNDISNKIRVNIMSSSILTSVNHNPWASAAIGKGRRYCLRRTNQRVRPLSWNYSRNLGVSLKVPVCWRKLGTHTCM